MLNKINSLRLLFIAISAVMVMVSCSSDKITNPPAVVRNCSVTVYSSDTSLGSITPNVLSADSGGAVRFSIQVKPWARFDSLTVNGVRDSALTAMDTSYVIGLLQHDVVVRVYFSVRQYALTADVSGSGVISPAGSTLVNYGGTQQYLLHATDSTVFDSLTVNGVSVTPVFAADTTYMLSGITADAALLAYFSAKRYTITASASGNGTVVPGGFSTAVYGGSLVYTLHATDSTHLDSVTANGAALTPVFGADTTVSLGRITGDVTLTAYFSVKIYTLNARVTGSGTISPAGALTVRNGASQKFILHASDGTCLDSVTVNGTAVAPVFGADTSVMLRNVRTDAVIQAYFSPLRYSLIADTWGSGTISPAGTITVSHGDSQTFRVHVTDSTILDSVTVNGVRTPVSFGTDTSLTLSNITAGAAIRAWFSAKPCILAAVAQGPGAIVPGDTVVLPYGASRTYALHAADSGRLDSVSVNGVRITPLFGVDTSATVARVTGNTVVKACFSLRKYSITAAVVGSGSISPSGVTSVEYGSSAKILIHAADSARLDSVLVNGVPTAPVFGTDTSVTLSHITHDASVTAYFTVRRFSMAASCFEKGVASGVLLGADYGLSKIAACTRIGGAHGAFSGNDTGYWEYAPNSLADPAFAVSADSLRAGLNQYYDGWNMALRDTLLADTAVIRLTDTLGQKAVLVLYMRIRGEDDAPVCTNDSQIPGTEDRYILIQVAGTDRDNLNSELSARVTQFPEPGHGWLWQYSTDPYTFIPITPDNPWITDPQRRFFLEPPANENEDSYAIILQLQLYDGVLFSASKQVKYGLGPTPTP